MKTKTKRWVNHIYSMRRNRRCKQKHLAMMLGLRRPETISKYENGKLLPPLQTALMLQIALGLQLSDLYPGLYENLQDVVLKRAENLPPHIRGPLVGRLLGKDLNEHS